MQLNEKIRFMRHIKKWSQEEVAYRLNLSPSAYGSIERGETKLSLPRLEGIAKVFEIDLAELVDFGEKQILNFSNIHSDNCQNWCNNPSSEQLLELQHKLEKAYLEMDYLKQQIADLREMVNLLKRENNRTRKYILKC